MSALDENLPPWITDRIGNEELHGVDTQIRSRYSSPTQRTEPIYTLQGYYVRETEKAVLFEIHQINGAAWDPEDPEDKWKRTQWFPLSQVKSITHAQKGGDSAIEYDNLQLMEWILKTKGII